MTGCGGYFANRLSLCDSWQSKNFDPVPLTICLTCSQLWQSDCGMSRFAYARMSRTTSPWTSVRRK